ncbi:hypothetical protein [Comamonas sp.]|uniref:hypothetical protein n=1 Tax=Comamonas sp. TaxID=34028 RepID=UPI003A914E92
MEAFTSMARPGTMQAIAASAKNKSLLSMKKQAFAEISWCPEPVTKTQYQRGFQ